MLPLKRAFPAELIMIARQKEQKSEIKAPEHLVSLSSGNETLDGKFELFSDNSMEAQAILTNQAAENVLRLHEYTGGCCNLKITLDGKAFVAVNSDRDLFEPGKRIEEIEQQIMKEIRYVADIIDLLHSMFASH